MNHKAFIVKKIDQIDNHAFSIEWADGVVTKYRLSDLQKACPCANCTDVKVVAAKKDEPLETDVRASSITSVGRYALRIQFTKGCSQGIFGFDMLRGTAS